MKFMIDVQLSSKTDLLAYISRSWRRLSETIDRLSPEQLAIPADAGGWTAKDHIAHLASWENSMVFLLQHKPRHQGLGVAESTYLNGTEDTINDAIFRHMRGESLADVLERLRVIHRDMLDVLGRLTSEDLRLTYSHYLPQEPGTDDGWPIINRVYGNTAHHFDLHRKYIERIVRGA